MVAADQLALGLGEVKRRPVGLGQETGIEDDGREGLLDEVPLAAELLLDDGVGVEGQAQLADEGYPNGVQALAGRALSSQLMRMITESRIAR